MQTDDGRLIVLAGKSRSGKTAYAARAVKRDPRVLAWDPHDQWGRLPGWQRFTSISEFNQATLTRGRARLAYVVGADDIKLRFEQFCATALQFGEVFGRCSVIGEELADVSSAGKAPGAWGALVRGALKRSMDLYPISQRWAEADKTALNNASEVVCFSMMPMDVKYMAARTGIPVDDLASLGKIETARKVICPYVRIEIATGRIERGQLEFRK
jgi:hypothetical protein